MLKRVSKNSLLSLTISIFVFFQKLIENHNRTFLLTKKRSAPQIFALDSLEIKSIKHSIRETSIDAETKLLF